MSESVQEDLVKTKVNLRILTRRLWPHLMRQKSLLGLTVIAILGLAIVGRLSVWLFGKAVDDGILKNDSEMIVRIAIAYLVMEVVGALAGYGHMFFFAKLGNRILYDLRSQLISHVQSLPISFFDKNPTGRIVTRVTNDVVSLGELFTQGIIMIFSNFISMIVTIIAMLLISWKMTLVTMLIAPPLIWISFVVSEKILVILRESKKTSARMNSFIAESVSGMRVLQLFERTSYSRSKFSDLSAQYREEQMGAVRLYALLWPTMSFFNAASIAVALYYGGIVTRDGAVTTGAMIAFLLHVRDFIQPLRVILEKYQNFQNSLAGAERIFTLLDEKPEDSIGRAIDPSRAKGAIEFQNLSFKYGATLPWVLNDVSFKANPGQSIALVGRTGSGKSTLISLMQRFYDYQQGDVLLDGVSLREISRAELRRRVGVVQQDTFMFRGTIADNIGLGDPSITRAQIESAAARASCADLLRRHVGGLDAKVEERGANLSFGERQLIAFARVLAFDPDILILDEATANIDSQSEQLIQKATREITKGRTSIIIAHRISTILDCDQILVLDHGNLIERGTHSELMAKGGHYYRLSASQFGLSTDLT